MSFRAVAVAGNWDSVSASAIQQAPLVKQQHPFSIFETQGQQQWVMMPAWSAVMVAAEPVALVIDDCAKLDVLMKQLQVKTYMQTCKGIMDCWALGEGASCSAR